MIFLNKLKALFNPEQYHGWGRDKRYFEGWYFKILNKTENKAFAIIPGIAMDHDKNKHAFIQVLDGKKCTAAYHRFEAESFKIKSGKFDLKIENNHFSIDQIQLDLPDFKAKLKFSNLTPWPNQWYSPGIMGPFAFVPFMECYHGILSMDHNIAGEVITSGETTNFNNGKGYIEKDWGHSFPSAYIWMQSNHFSESEISLKLSVAKIPWLGSSFVGFIAGLWIKERLIQFTTYNFTKLLKSHVDQKTVHIILKNSIHQLDILAHRQAGTELASPIHGFMDGRISESMTAKIQVILRDRKDGKIIFEDTGRNAGLEIAGQIEEILI